MNPDQNEMMGCEQVMGVVMGDVSQRANAALKYLDWLEGVTGPRWIGTDKGAVKQDGRKASDGEIEVRKAALHYLRLHFLGEMD
jgi:hypothetical protein